MRRQDRRPAPRAAQLLDAAGERVEAVGVDHQRHVDAQHELARERLRAAARGRGPGPSTTASARSIADERRLDRLGRQRAVLARAGRRIIASSSRTVNAQLERSPARRPSRSPRRRASRPGRPCVGAPVSPREPPRMNTLPRAELGRGRRRGAAARAARRAPISPTRGSAGAPRGMPMSTTVDLAGVRLAGVDPQPRLGAVERGGRGGAHRGARRPRPSRRRRRSGTSAAITRRARRVDGLDHPVERVARRALEAVPSSASTIPCAFVEPRRRRTAPARGAGQALELRRARRRSASRGGQTSSTSTSRPASRSRRAATSPSPPLLPLPQTTAIRPAGTRSATTRRAPRPRAPSARATGRPRSSIAQLVDRAHAARRRAAAPASAASSCGHRHGARHAARVRERDRDLDAELVRARCSVPGEPHARRPRRCRGPRRRAGSRPPAPAPWPRPPWRRTAPPGASPAGPGRPHRPARPR